MKSVITILVIFISTCCFAQTKREQRKSRHAFKVGDLQGVNYPRTVKPTTVKWVLITVVIGIAVGQVAKEESGRLKK